MEFFENNLINWLILAAILVFMWNKYMPGIFEARRKKIEQSLDDAARARKEGNDFLLEQKQRIDNAAREAENILLEANQVAAQMKQQFTEETKKDAKALEQKIEQQIATHRQMVITELRSSAATVAVRLAEASLPGAITDKVKHGLQERFLNQLDSAGGASK